MTTGSAIWQYPVKLKIFIPYSLLIPILMLVSKETCRRMLIAASFVVANIWKQPKSPMVEVWGINCGMFIKWNAKLN